MMEMDVAQPNQPTAYHVLEESRTAMEEIAAKMIFIKKEGRPKSELRELITQMALHFVTLRQVNRSILLEEDRVKAETENAKQPLDFTTLQLHNLMYEKNHYLKAIKACKDFKSKHPNITLVPEEEFFSGAPEEIKGSIMSNDSTHDLMLKRLNYELFQRKKLCKLHEKLEQHKKGLLETIANRKKFLSSLPSHLKSLKKASLPVQQQLGMLHTKKLKQHRAAELLPPPLYIVYSQLLSQKEAFGENIEMEIQGSIKDAQAFTQQQACKDNGISKIAENSKMDEDVPEEEDDGQRRRKRPKKVLGKDDIDHSGVHQSHPLYVILHIYDDQDRDGKPMKLISLRFEYFVKLNVVCTGIEGAEEGTDGNILCNLFPDDTGMELPHQTAKLYNRNSVAFEEKKTLHPYKWAQHLAGMDFLPEISPLLTMTESPGTETPRGGRVLSGLTLYRQQNRVQTVIQRIRSRRKAQLALVEQLDSLSNLKWPSLSHENVPWALHTPTCALQRWLSIGLTADPVASFSAFAAEQVSEPLDLNLEVRSETLKEDAENTREDGELPSALQVLSPTGNSKLTPSKQSSDLGHSRSLSLISKSVTSCSSSKGKPQNSAKNEDTSELLLDSDSDMEQQYMEPETEDSNVGCYVRAEKSWEEYAVKEYLLVLKKMDKDRSVNLEAKIKISAEYPLRPPLFSLSLSIDETQEDSVSHEKDGFRWYNKLRAMEAEVNLHILKILPLDFENYILAHQVHCLAMLFDFQLDQSQTCTETGNSSSIIDIGLCQPVNGRILARSFRGRDRRKMISWKGMECTQGYP